MHVSIPTKLYSALKERSAREARPLEELVEEAIASWLSLEQKREAESQLKAYIQRFSGTSMDFDPELEDAGLEAIAE